MDILKTSWPNGWSPDILIEAAQTGRRMTLQPVTAREELEKPQRDMPVIVEAISKMDVDCRTAATALQHLGHATTCVTTKPEHLDRTQEAVVRSRPGSSVLRRK